MLTLPWLSWIRPQGNVGAGGGSGCKDRISWLKGRRKGRWKAISVRRTYEAQDDSVTFLLLLLLFPQRLHFQMLLLLVWCIKATRGGYFSPFRSWFACLFLRHGSTMTSGNFKMDIWWISIVPVARIMFEVHPQSGGGGGGVPIIIIC